MTEPANAGPTASFTATENGLSVTFNASGSTDGDGNVVGYSWNFGDGQTSTAGPTVTHTYAAANTYTVILQVTDDDGATDDATDTVTVADIPGRRSWSTTCSTGRRPTAWAPRTWAAPGRWAPVAPGSR